LPTEAQWEYACRAGTTTPVPANLEEIAWFRNTSGGRLHEVGMKSPNPWGLFDMLGNIAEWCRDWYVPSYEGLPSIDPEGGSEGKFRVVRGGCWASVATGCRSAKRGRADPGRQTFYVGFRLCLVPEKSSELPLWKVSMKGVKIGWGTPGINVSVDLRTPLEIMGRKFKHGLGVHSPSVLSFALDGKADEFHALVGVDKTGEKGTVEFQIFLDGKAVWRSGVMRNNQPAKEVSVPLLGAKKLVLATTIGGDDYHSDHADWAEAVIKYHGKAPKLVVSESRPDFDPTKSK
jgi:hypothetical protein